MINKIYLDMDGVLTDFNTRYIGLYGNTSKTKWKENWEHWVLTEQFKHLDWHVDGRMLLQAVKETGIPYEILSSSGGEDYYDTIKEQKIHWLQSNGFDCPINVVAGKKYKQDYAAAYHILIDDHLDNVDEFKTAGGFAIHHTDLDSTLFQLDLYFRAP